MVANSQAPLLKQHKENFKKTSKCICKAVVTDGQKRFDENTVSGQHATAETKKETKGRKKNREQRMAADAQLSPPPSRSLSKRPVNGETRPRRRRKMGMMTPRNSTHPSWQARLRQPLLFLSPLSLPACSVVSHDVTEPPPPPHPRLGKLLHIQRHSSDPAVLECDTTRGAAGERRGRCTEQKKEARARHCRVQRSSAS
jgi:hypothetical protein